MLYWVHMSKFQWKGTCRRVPGSVSWRELQSAERPHAGAREKSEAKGGVERNSCGLTAMLKVTIFREKKKIARENVIQITLRNLRFDAVKYRLRFKWAHIQLVSINNFHTQSQQKQWQVDLWLHLLIDWNKE